MDLSDPHKEDPEVRPPILIADFSHQDAGVLMRRRYQELDVFTIRLKPEEIAPYLAEEDNLIPAGVIALGGSVSMYRPEFKTIEVAYSLGVPVLATSSTFSGFINFLGGHVIREGSKKRMTPVLFHLYKPEVVEETSEEEDSLEMPLAPEKGEESSLVSLEPEELFVGLEEFEEVWMHHSDTIPIDYRHPVTGHLASLPEECVFMAQTVGQREVAAVRHVTRPWYGVQFQLEHEAMYKRADGRVGPGMILLQNFASICYRRLATAPKNFSRNLFAP